MAREIRLNAFHMNTVGHQSPGLWAHPRDQSHRYKELRYWTELAQTLERGRFDGLFLADVLGVYDVYGGSRDAALHHAVQVPVNDPLLLVLLIEAALIHRAALGMGWGLVNRCWGAFVAAILLTCAGDIIAWANAYVPLPWQVNALSWHIWFVAGAAFALGPAHQLQAVQRISWNVRTLVHRNTRGSGTRDLNTGAA